MLIRWNDMDDTLGMYDELRRQVSRLANLDTRRVSNMDLTRPKEWSRGWPWMRLVDSGKNIVLRAEVPGLSEDEIEITVNQDVLTVGGERKADVPEGYRVHRHERASVKFSRSFALPCKVDLEQATAVAKNGVLTVNLPKTPESQPREITVKAV